MKRRYADKGLNLRPSLSRPATAGWLARACTHRLAAWARTECVDCGRQIGTCRTCSASICECSQARADR